MSRVSHQPTQRPMGRGGGYNQYNQSNQQSTPPPQQQRIVLLRDSDFKAISTQKGHIVHNNLAGVSFVFFGSNKCKYCPSVMEMVKALPAYLGASCTVAIVNVDNDKSILQLSKGTPLEITYVPFLAVYNNGAPVHRYEGKKDLASVVNFMREFIPQLKKATPAPFMKSEKKTEDNDLGLPYNIYCDDEMCYLTDGELSNGKAECEDGQCCFLSDKEL